MLNFKRGMALLLAVCMIMGYVLIGKPVAASAETYDPYVYTFEPAPSTVPTYYQKYAKAFAGWSPHMLPPDYEAVWMFNLVNMSELIEDQASAPSGGYATVQTFCSDLYIDVNFTNRYRRIELEDAKFDSSSGGTKNAEHIRAIVEKSMPYIADPTVVQDAANAYLGKNKVKELSGSELASAIQAAIWHYSDADEFVFDNSLFFEKDNPYFGEVNYSTDARYSWMIPKVEDLTSPLDFDEPYINPRTSDNIYGVYRYLLNLAPQKPEDVMIPQDAIYMESAVIMGSGSNCTLNLTVGINGTIDDDDELVLTAKCGSQTKTYQLGMTTTAEKVGDGLYALTFTGVSMADCASVELALSGEQRVTGAFFFEAEPRGGMSAKYSSQSMVGYLNSSAAPVQAKSTVKPLANAVTNEITKMDARSGNPLAGVTFDLYMKKAGGDVKVGTFTTDENGKISIMVTDATAEYYFVETDTLPGYEAISDSVSAGQVTNDWTSGSLAITKILNNGTSADKTFTFNVTLDLSEADVVENGLSWMTDDYFKGLLTGSKAISWSVAGNRKLAAAVTVDAGETVTIDGIPLGAAYTVEEVLTADEQKLYTVTAQVDGGAAQNSTTVSGSVSGENAIEFTNTEIVDNLSYGQLTVSKELVNTTEAVPGETFTFEITIELPTEAVQNTLPWVDDAYLLGKITSTEKLTWTEKDGKYTTTVELVVKQNETESVTISGLAYGTVYTVKEILPEGYEGWYNVTAKVNGTAQNDIIVTETVDGKEVVEYTNTVSPDNLQYGELTVSKELVNTTEAVPGETFTFEITVDLPTEAVKNTLPWVDDAYLLGKITSSEKLTWTEKDGKYTTTVELVVKQNETESVTISGLAYGTVYTVKEILPEGYEGWYNVTAKVNGTAQNDVIVTETVDGKEVVEYTNTVSPDNLQYGELTVSKELVNTTEAVPGETFTFEITIDLPTEAVKNTLPWVDDAYLLGKITSSEKLTWTEKDGKYTTTVELVVKQNETESVTVNGLAYGTVYTVKEILPDGYDGWYNVTAKVNGTAQNDIIVTETVDGKEVVEYTNTVSPDNLQYGELTVSKELVNTTEAVPGETFTFEITVDLPTETVKNTLPWVNDDYLLGKITSTEKLTWTEKDGKYTTTVELVVKQNETESVTVNGLAYGTVYTVKEILPEGYEGWYSVTAKVNGTAQNDIIVTETVDGKEVVEYTNTVIPDQLSYGQLTVSKELVNTTEAVPGETFTFEITIDLPTEAVKNTLPWVDDAYLLGKITSSEKLTWTEKDGKYTTTVELVVKQNETESVTINGLAYGTVYTVKEILPEGYEGWYNVTAKVNGTAQNDVIVTETVDGKEVVEYTNTVVDADVQVGELSVSKKLINTTPAEPGETFNFKLIIDLSTADVYADDVPWMNDAYLLGLITASEELTWTSEDGKYTTEFTVDVDETVTIGGIAQGTAYTVEEIQTEEDRKWFTVTTQIGENEAEDGNAVESTIAEQNALIFTNAVVVDGVKYGELSVSKELINTTPAQPDETFNFRITIELPTEAWKEITPWIEDNYLLGKIVSDEELVWTAEDGKYTATFTVDAGETVTIGGIAQGTAYTVEEIQTEEDRKWFTVTSKVDDNEASEGVIAEGSIAEENAVLFTNSVITAEVELGKLEVSKKLINAAPAQKGETFNFSIVVDFSCASVYANTTPWMNDAYLLSLVTSSKELTWTENEDGTYTAAFTLKADEAITIEGLAVGTGYTLREELTAEDRKVYEVTTQIAAGGTVAEANKGYEAGGSIAAENAVRFTNEVVKRDGPDTGDAGIGMPLLLGIVSLLSASILVLKRRRFIG